MGFSFKKELGKVFSREGAFGRGPQDITPEPLKQIQGQARDVQKSALSQLMGVQAPTLESITGEVESEKQAIRSSAEDTLRRLRDLRAARGQVNTSLGQGTEAGMMRQSALQQAMLGTTIPERLRQAQISNAMQRIQGAGGVMSAPGTIVMDQGKQGWVPGQMEAGGAIFGGIFGGPAGAQAGGSAGRATGQGMASTFSR